MKVALFGRSGFIGSRVADILQQKSIASSGVSRSEPFASIPTDVDSAIICSSKLPQRTYSLKDIKEFINSNVVGLLDILSWAEERKISRIVYCSTLSMMPGASPELIDTRSHYPYKISKAAAEHLFTAWCREQKVSYMVLRIASVFGPGMKPDVLSTMIDSVTNGTVFTLSNKQAAADFVHIDDVATALVAALTAEPNRVVDATSGAPVLLVDAWKTIAKILGKENSKIDVKTDQPVNTPPVFAHSLQFIDKQKAGQPGSGFKRTYRKTNPMKVLLISDVHGNLPALEALLKVEKDHDQVVSLGDVVDYGPWSNECVDLLEDIRAINLMGNHEEYFIVGKMTAVGYPLVQQFFTTCHADFKRLDVIKKYLPEYKLGTFTCRHTIGNTYIFPDTPVDLQESVFIGHSHVQFSREINNFKVVNTGSVGQNRQEINVINYATFDTSKEEVTLKELVYDHTVVVQKMIEKDYPPECVAYYQQKKTRA